MGNPGRKPPPYQQQPLTNHPNKSQLAAYANQLANLANQQGAGGYWSSALNHDLNGALILWHPIWVWLLWAGFINYSTTESTKDLIGMIHELDSHRLDMPDEWAAFVAVQRIQGRDLWDTAAT